MHGNPVAFRGGRRRRLSAVAAEARSLVHSSTEEEEDVIEEPSSSEESHQDPTFAGEILQVNFFNAEKTTQDPFFVDESLHLKFCKAVLRFSRSSGRASVQELRARPARCRTASYNMLMTAIAEIGDVEDLLRLFQEMKRGKCKPNVLCYNTVINALVEAGRLEEARATYEEMFCLGIRCNLSSYNILMRMHACCSKDFDSAYKVILIMKKDGICPDVTTYSILITGLCSDGRIEEAWGVLDRMLEEKCQPTIRTFIPIVQGYCSEGKIKEAKRLMATMENVGCSPETMTYNILIHALCKASKFDEVEEILVESDCKGWRPSEITYNTYMDGLCKSGKTKEAFKQLENMLMIGLYPTEYTLNILLNCLCYDSKEVLVAKCLIERSFELKWDVTVVDYNTVMSRLCDAGYWVGVLKLFNDMIKKGITPNLRTFNIVIHSLCIGGKFHKASCLMNSGDFIGNVVTYNTLIHWFYLDGNINEAQHAIASMSAKNIMLDEITYGTIVDGLCRSGKFLEAIDFFHMSLEHKFSSDLLLRLIYRLVKNRGLKELLKLFTGIEKRGLFLDGLIFDSLIKAFCNQGVCQSIDMPSVCIILDKMLVRR
ncbi:pentatricopeptide repeat-containing protein At1g09900-like [Zingiber officinale]|uniref:pentatricopeptide repeat-containing protein At1g09900-like n=1 Tax=Zingiber officinale TaxID=94328 RepID=UPI001C4C44AA|nr:pentatricopeptide repeat-containing protein At1g09900-like [Zingiber officinale]